MNLKWMAAFWGVAGFIFIFAGPVRAMPLHESPPPSQVRAEVAEATLILFKNNRRHLLIGPAASSDIFAEMAEVAEIYRAETTQKFELWASGAIYDAGTRQRIFALAERVSDLRFDWSELPLPLMLSFTHQLFDFSADEHGSGV